MVFLFRSGTVREKARLILRATRQHARNLAVYATLYKLTLYLLRTTRPSRKELHYDTFLAGLLGGYVVFGRRGAASRPQSSVNQQITIYVFARVVLALAKLLVTHGFVPDPAGRTSSMAWPLFASLSWAAVMYLFRWYPDMLQPSLRSSMKYMSVIHSNQLPYVILRVCRG